MTKEIQIFDASCGINDGPVSEMSDEVALVIGEQMLLLTVDHKKKYSKTVTFFPLLRIMQQRTIIEVDEYTIQQGNIY